MQTLPLFPLGSVLFPGARLPLTVFEPRYVDLIRDCLKQQRGFGIVWIREGSEVIHPQENPMPRLAQIGTLAEIVDWDAASGGRLAVTVEGRGKFRLLATRQRPDYLVIGDVEWLTDEEPLPLLDSRSELAALLDQLLHHPALRSLGVVPNRTDAGMLAQQLAQYLPIDEAGKFELLAEADPVRRLDGLLQLLERLSS